MTVLALALGLTVISAAPASASVSASSWSCAYVAERLPRTLGLLGDDTVSAEETRTARKRLALGDAVLTRASGLTLARALGGTRLIVVRCLDHDGGTTIEARSFDAQSPQAGEIVKVSGPLLDLAATIDQVATHLSQGLVALAPGVFRSPSRQALTKAGPAFIRESAAERALGLQLALAAEPGSIDLRLSAVEATIAARDFDGAIRLAAVLPDPGAPHS